MEDSNVLDDALAKGEKLVQRGKTKSVYIFMKNSKEDVAESVGNLFAKKGYKLEVGTPDNGVYGKGSKVLRVLLGAFYKRFAFLVSVKSDEDRTILSFSKSTKGYAGGAIGISQVNKEYNEIGNILEGYHAKYNPVEE